MFKMQILIFLSSMMLFISSGVKASNEEGIAFLQANRNKEGVIELPSGLQYKVLKKGTGAFHPTVDSPCLCHYEGTLIDGTEFDSSYGRGQPTTFAPNQVIGGWTEAMQLMVEGDKFELYIPSELAYGARGSPPKIPPDSVLVFRMEILEIKGDKKPALTCNTETKENCNEKESAYIDKIAGWDDQKTSSELARVSSLIEKGAMKPELEEWMQRRRHILAQVVPSQDEL